VKFSGDLTIDFAGRRLSCQGSLIALTKKEFDIIAASFCAVT
jgi:DNA-binding response OmpR family regulator